MSDHEIQSIYWEEIANKAQDVLEATSNEKTRLMVALLLSELALKQQLLAAELTEAATSETGPVKRFGMFVVVEQTAPCDDLIQGETLRLHDGTPYLNVHIPPVADREALTLSRARHDYTSIAEYIRRQDVPIQYVLGVTYRRLAATARRQNFTVEPLGLPTPILGIMEFAHNKLFPQGQVSAKKLGEPTLVYHTRDSFLTEFPPG